MDNKSFGWHLREDTATCIVSLSLQDVDLCAVCQPVFKADV